MKKGKNFILNQILSTVHIWTLLTYNSIQFLCLTNMCKLFVFILQYLQTDRHAYYVLLFFLLFFFTILFGSKDTFKVSARGILTWTCFVSLFYSLLACSLCPVVIIIIVVFVNINKPRQFNLNVRVGGKNKTLNNFLKQTRPQSKLFL